MFSFESEANLVQDREDLLQVLQIRFGSLEPSVIEAVYNLSDLNAIERLILVAANAPTYSIFLEELKLSDQSFRLVGERFNPVNFLEKGGTMHEKAE